MRLVPVPQDRKVPRDGWDRPLVVPEGGGKPKAHTRTTTFIDCIEDKSNLSTWKMRQVLIGAAMERSTLAVVSSLDMTKPLDKTRLNALAERMLDLSGANDKREQGTHLHSLSELVDAGLALPPGTSEVDVVDMMAYMLGTTDFSFRHVEKLVVVNSLCTAGTPDRVGLYTGPGPLPGMYFEDELLITDLKTGSTEYGKLKIASQLATYSRGKFYNHDVFGFHSDMQQDKAAFTVWKNTVFDAELAETAYTSIGDVNQEWGVVFSLPSGSGVLTLKWVDLTIGWELAQLALTIRAARSRKGAMLPFLPT